MLPAENSIYKTLGLLTMLSRSRKQLFPNLSEEEKAKITVSKQILTDAGLTIPEFSNALHEISKKGYIWHILFFDENVRSQFDSFVNSPQYSEALEKLKVLNTKEVSDNFKASLAKDFERILPYGMKIDQEEIDSDELTFTQAFEEGINLYKNMRTDEVALVVLMPFREISRLYERVGNGEKFADIKDDGLWYDQNNFEFHIHGDVVSTSYQGKYNVEHDVLIHLIDNFDEGVIWYDDIENRTPRSLKDALLKFIEKNDKLKNIFTVHHDRLEFRKESFR